MGAGGVVHFSAHHHALNLVTARRGLAILNRLAYKAAVLPWFFSRRQVSGISIRLLLLEFIQPQLTTT